MLSAHPGGANKHFLEEEKNTAKLYGDVLVYTAVFIDWLDWLDWLDSRSPAGFIDWLDWLEWFDLLDSSRPAVFVDWLD